MALRRRPGEWLHLAWMPPAPRGPVFPPWLFLGVSSSSIGGLASRQECQRIMGNGLTAKLSGIRRTLCSRLQVLNKASFLSVPGVLTCPSSRGPAHAVRSLPFSRSLRSWLKPSEAAQLGENPVIISLISELIGSIDWRNIKAFCGGHPEGWGNITVTWSTTIILQGSEL